MSERKTLSATVRTRIGKNANRQLRAQGITPGVFYAAGGISTPIQVEESRLNKIYTQVGRTTVFDLEINDNGAKSVQPCLIWDAEYYPTKNRFLHIDFYGVDLDKELKRRVALEFTGTAKGTKLGGKLEVYREDIYVLSKPLSLPSKIVVDISELDVNQGLRVADLIMPEGVRASYDDNFAILNVLAPGSGKDAGDKDE